MMNEFVAKKLGEVLAFAVVGKEIFEKGKDALTSVLANEGVGGVIENVTDHATAITKLAESESISAITLPKSQKTGDKLRQMIDLYVGDQWDNPTEILEWLGFFEGAALVHWKLVDGAGMALGDAKLQNLAGQGITFHQNLLAEVAQALHKVGSAKAKL
jgi:hypothetical protein